MPTVTNGRPARSTRNTLMGGYGLADARPGPQPTERIRQVADRLGWIPNDLPTLAEFRCNPRARRKAIRRMLSDEAVKGGLLEKVFGVSQLTLQCKPARKDNPADVQAAELCRFNIEERLPSGLPGLIENIGLHSLIEDHSLCEPVWPAPGVVEEEEPWRGKRMLVDVKARGPDTYTLNTDPHGTIIGVSYTNEKGDRITDPPSSFVIFRYLSLYSSPASGYTDTEGAYNHFLSKVTAIRMRAILEDRLSGGFLVVKGDPNSEQLKADCAAARGMGYIIIQPGNEADILDLAAGSAETFRNGIQDRDKAIWTNFCGAYLHVMESSTPNARGGAKIALTGSELRQYHFAAALSSSALTRQIAPMIVRENVPGAARPKLVLSSIDPAYVKSRIEIALMMKELVGPKNLGLEQFYEESGYGPPKNPKDHLPEPEVDPFAGLPNDPNAPPSNQPQ